MKTVVENEWKKEEREKSRVLEKSRAQGKKQQTATIYKQAVKETRPLVSRVEEKEQVKGMQ